MQLQQSGALERHWEPIKVEGLSNGYLLLSQKVWGMGGNNEFTVSHVGKHKRSRTLSYRYPRDTANIQIEDAQRFMDSYPDARIVRLISSAPLPLSETHETFTLLYKGNRIYCTQLLSLTTLRRDEDLRNTDIVFTDEDKEVPAEAFNTIILNTKAYEESEIRGGG